MTEPKQAHRNDEEQTGLDAAPRRVNAAEGNSQRVLRGAATGVLVAACLATGCDPASEFRPDPDAIPLEEIIDVRRADNSTIPLRADGTDTTTLLAHIPGEASSRAITFRTTGGVFPLSGSREVEIRAERSSSDVSGRLVARVLLQTDTIPRVAIVSALIGGFRDTVSVVFVR